MFTWNEQWSMGIPEIDHQHKELIELIGEIVLCAAKKLSKEDIEKIFHELETKMTRHFSREVSYMKEYKYPDISEHAAEHKKVLEDLKIVKTNVFDYDDMSISELLVSLKNYFVRHLITTDQKLYDYLKEQKFVV
jgi:hemerythrin-like metal-binding protein